VVLGKAKVMSHVDLVEARVKRATKDAAKAQGKGKCNRKRTSEAAEPMGPPWCGGANYRLLQWRE